MKLTFAQLFFGGILTGFVACYPNSVPNSPDVCSKMIPGHGPRPQTTPSPYEVVLNKQALQGGNNLQIVVQGKDGENFKGFYIQARDQDGSPIGMFQSVDEKEAYAHSCFSMKNNAIHHRNKNDKESITVYWKAPEAYQGKVRVLATVVKDFDTFWSGVQAPELVSVSNYFTPKSFSNVPEKGETKSSKLAKTSRILNYNPYSPFSPLEMNATSEFLLSQPSDELSIAFRQRNLFGYPTFDFHGGGYPSRIPPTANSLQNSFVPPPHTLRFPGSNQAPPFKDGNHFQIPPASYSQHVPHPHHSPELQKYDNLAEKRNPSRFPSKPLPLNYPPLDIPYPIYPPLDNYKPSVGISKDKVYSDYHHVAHDPHQEISYFNSYPYPTPKPYHKPASTPGYPNSGYFPKDLLTKLTSYIPNIYNALSNNALFSFSKEDSIESVWKPTSGAPFNFNPQPITPPHHFATYPQASNMPKYGYLVYNPKRDNPYFMIPAENENDFIDKYISKNPNAHAHQKYPSFRF